MRTYSVVAITSNLIGRGLMLPTLEVGGPLVTNNVKSLNSWRESGVTDEAGGRPSVRPSV